MTTALIRTRRLPLAAALLLAAAVLAAAVLAAGCGSSMRVAHGHDAGADFSQYQTFDWQPRPDDASDPLLAAPDVAFQIKNAVEAALAEKGYEKVDADPDFYVAVHAALREQLTHAYIDRWGYSWRRPGWRTAGWEGVVDTYEEGTLILDVVDPTSDELVWRGTATDAVPADADVIRDRVDEAVARILRPFPPR